MRIGIPAETRAGETRVAATPETVKKMLATGHTVMVEKGAGLGASIPDAEFQAAGASLVSSADVYAKSEIVLKVKAAFQPLLDASFVPLAQKVSECLQV